MSIGMVCCVGVVDVALGVSLCARVLVDVDWHEQLFLRLPVDVDIGMKGCVAAACRCRLA